MISDTGIGIPDDKLSSLFEPFTQASEGYGRQFQGAGLGLAICKRLVDMMKGTICVDSNEGSGTTFYIGIPFGTTDPYYQKVLAVREPKVLSSDNCKVLLVEDERVNRLTAQKLLEKSGCEVLTAQNGQEGLDVLRENAIDMVLMDIQMPIMDGVKATRAIRAGEAGADKKDIPIIALTAHAMHGDREKFLGFGMDDYLSKPVEIEEIKDVLDKMLGEVN